MTEEERAARDAYLRGAMMNAAVMKNDLPAPVTQRLDWLEADASAQRTAILKLERDVKLIALAVLVPMIVLAVLT